MEDRNNGAQYVEMKAREHAEAAQREWEKAKSGYASAKILTTLGYVEIATVGAIDTPEGMTRFFDSAKLFHEASKIEPDNALYYNVLGWIFLRLAEWEAKDLRLADRIPPGLVNRIPPEEDSSPAGKSEYHFLESLKCDPTNKLPHANLCRLYALKRYREKDRDESLSRCREHGEAAIRLDPNYINGYRDLTLGLLMYEQFDEAYPHFEKALELTSEQFAAPDKKHREIIGDMLGILEDNPEIEADKEELARWRNPALVTR